MSGELETYFVVLAVDREPIRGFIESVVPATYQPPSSTRWCMVKAATQGFAIQMATEAYTPELRADERLAVVSVGRLCGHERVG